MWVGGVVGMKYDFGSEILGGDLMIFRCIERLDPPSPLKKGEQE